MLHPRDYELSPGGIYEPRRRVLRPKRLNPGVVAGGAGGGSSLLTGIIAYYKFDEASGNPADATGNGHTLTNISAGTFTAGKINNGFRVNSESYATDSGHAILTGSQSALSIALWMNRDVNAPMTVGYYDTAADRCSLAWYDDGNLYTFCKNASVGGSTTYANADTGTHHFVFVFDGGQVTAADRLKLYYDGTLLGGGAQSGTYPTTFTISGDFTFGRIDYAAVYSNGIFDECGVWSRAITSGEVTTLYNVGVGRQYPF